MSSMNFADIWNLQSLYKFEIDDDVSSSLICVKCKLIMADPFLTSCDCHFCRHCIIDLLEKTRTICPGGKPDCRETILEMGITVGNDVVARQKILRMQLKCPNEYCSFRTQLEKMEEHIRTCTMRLVECPFESIGCISFSGRRDSVGDHLRQDVLEHSQLILEMIRNLRNDVDGLMKSLELKDLEIMELKEEANRNKRKIDEISEDDRQKKILILDLEVKIEEVKAAVTKTERDKEEQKMNVDNCFTKKEKTKEINSRRSISSTMKNELHFEDVELKDFEWCILNFSGKDGRHYSDPFSFDKYLLRLGLYFVNEEFMQLSVCIMLGDEDDLVSWPMTDTITVSIINQATNKVYKFWRINMNNYKNPSAFNRPQYNENVIECDGLFIEDHPDLLSNDSLKVTCSLSK